jgi:hypothetical protein
MRVASKKPLVTKTKLGKFSFCLSRDDRDSLFSALASYVESESIKSQSAPLKTIEDVKRKLYYLTLEGLLTRSFAKLVSPYQFKERFQVTPAEAVALISFLSPPVQPSLLEIRNALHKILS